MKLGAISNTNSFSMQGRLSKEDILRLPSPRTNKADFYTSTHSFTKKNQKSHIWRNIFTALTFGLTGLYIAHRNNLFNPARKEAKKIIKSDALIHKIKSFVSSAIIPEIKIRNRVERNLPTPPLGKTYEAAIRRTLKKLSEDNSRGKKFVQEAKNIIKNKKSMQELFRNVSKVLADDSNKESLINGYTTDILDSLLRPLEKTIRNIKQSGKPYKDQGAALIEQLFKKNGKAASTIEDLLYDVIDNRSKAAVEGFIQDSIISKIN